jgi:hypothetical protein
MSPTSTNDTLPDDSDALPAPEPPALDHHAAT